MRARRKPAAPHPTPCWPPFCSDAIERNVWELHRMHVAGVGAADGNTSDARPLPLTAAGVVRAARLGED